MVSSSPVIRTTAHSEAGRGVRLDERVRCCRVDPRRDGPEDLVAAGSHAEAARRGQQRLEGKTYIVRDGDVLNIRFNV